MKSIIISLLLVWTLSIQSQDLYLYIINPQVTGTQVVYDVYATGFTSVVGAQYAIEYDPSILTYTGVQNINVPDMTDTDFYNNQPGSVIHQYLDLTQEGVTLPDSTLMYQLVFQMVNDSLGGVCFSQDSRMMEIVNVDNELFNVYVVDDCHSDPFLFVGEPSAVENQPVSHGLDVYTFNEDHTISFSLKDQQELAFKLYDLKGRFITSFPQTVYSAGEHTLNLHAPVTPGMYILVTDIGKQKIGTKILFAD